MLMLAILTEGLPPEELEFHWKGGAPSLDLCATVGERWRRNFERLRRPTDLARWISDSGLVDGPVEAAAVGVADLEHARELREAIDRLARPTRDPEPGDRELINGWAAGRLPAVELTEGFELRRRVVEDVAGEVLSALARDAVELLATTPPERIRECDAPDCALLFVDHSRPGARRWCTTGGCGNRVRTRAYRRRRKEASG